MLEIEFYESNIPFVDVENRIPFIKRNIAVSSLCRFSCLQYAWH